MVANYTELRKYNRNLFVIKFETSWIRSCLYCSKCPKSYELADLLETDLAHVFFREFRVQTETIEYDQP